MSPTTTTPMPAPASTPASPPKLETELVEEEAFFPPSAELGDQLQHLADDQAEIDRKKAEELARLREIQSRD